MSQILLYKICYWVMLAWAFILMKIFKWVTGEYERLVDDYVADLDYWRARATQLEQILINTSRKTRKHEQGR